MASGEQTLKFIKVDDSKEKHLRQAAQYAKKYELEFIWISVNDLQYDDLDAEYNSVYVLDPFEGEHFDILKEKKCRIVGPQCVISCAQTNTPLPCVRYPVYNVVMRGVYACCTSVLKPERAELQKLIRLMGGEAMNTFTDEVTHLVAGEVGSEKYKVACKLKKPVVLPSWIYHCWKIGKLCSSDEELRSFACPVFKGFTICVTGVENEEREEVKRILRDNGGTYSGQLDVSCTHLIVGLPRGAKYECARKWRIHCVSTKWLYDSAKSNWCCDEKGYYTLPEEQCSSLGESVAAQTSDLDVTFVEAEPVEGGGLLTGKLFCIDGFAEDHVIKHLVKMIEDHGGIVVHSCSQVVSDFAILPMNKQPSKETKAKQMVTFCWLEQSLQQGKLLEQTENFLFQPFCIPEGCQPLADCVLSTSQYNGVEREHLVQLAELLGAICQEYFARKANSKYRGCTHLLCQEPVGKKYTAALSWEIPVVSDKWLFACAMTGQNVDTKEYPLAWEKHTSVKSNDHSDSITSAKPNTSAAMCVNTDKPAAPSSPPLQSPCKSEKP